MNTEKALLKLGKLAGATKEQSVFAATEATIQLGVAVLADLQEMDKSIAKHLDRANGLLERLLDRLEQPKEPDNG